MLTLCSLCTGGSPALPVRGVGQRLHHPLQAPALREGQEGGARDEPQMGVRVREPRGTGQRLPPLLCARARP